MKMNIKKRLAVSNLLMLLIPVAVVLITGLVFLIIIFSMLNSDGFRFGEERFYDHKDEIVGMIEDCLSSDSSSEGLTDIINSAGQSDLRIIVEENGEKFMLFYGMSSESAMKRHVGGVAEYRAAEGKTVKLPLRGPVENTARDILGGLRSACTYVGASRLKELTKRTTFIRVQEQENRIFNNL